MTAEYKFRKATEIGNYGTASALSATFPAVTKLTDG